MATEYDRILSQIEQLQQRANQIKDERERREKELLAKQRAPVLNRIREEVSKYEIKPEEIFEGPIRLPYQKADLYPGGLYRSPFGKEFQAGTGPLPDWMLSQRKRGMAFESFLVGKDGLTPYERRAKELGVKRVHGAKGSVKVRPAAGQNGKAANAKRKRSQ